MTMQNFNKAFAVPIIVAPVFYYLGFVLYVLSGLSGFAALAKTPSFLIVSAIFFVMGYNAFRTGRKLRDQ